MGKSVARAPGPAGVRELLPTGGAAGRLDGRGQGPLLLQVFFPAAEAPLAVEAASVVEPAAALE